MKHNHRSLIIILSASFLLLLASCAPHDTDAEWGEGGDDHNNGVAVEVHVLWDKAGVAAPRYVNIMAWPADGQKARQFMLDGTGGIVHLLEGTYRIMGYNSDTETIVERDMDDWRTATLTTTASRIIAATTAAPARVVENAPRAPETENEAILNPPDKLWRDTLMRAEISAESHTITLHPTQLTASYDVYIEINSGAERLVWASGTLSGMAGASLAFPDRPTEPRATIPFDIITSREGDEMHSAFSTFGDTAPPGGQCPKKHYLMLYMQTVAGGLHSFQYDVTDQIHSAKDPKHVVVRISGLDIPEDEGIGSNVDVRGWNNEYIDLEMPFAQ